MSRPERNSRRHRERLLIAAQAPLDYRLTLSAVLRLLLALGVMGNLQQARCQMEQCRRRRLSSLAAQEEHLPHPGLAAQIPLKLVGPCPFR